MILILTTSPSLTALYQTRTIRKIGTGTAMPEIILYVIQTQQGTVQQTHQMMITVLDILALVKIDRSRHATKLVGEKQFIRSTNFYKAKLRMAQ